jgi:hypothetical protein
MRVVEGEGVGQKEEDGERDTHKKVLSVNVTASSIPTNKVTQSK